MKILEAELKNFGNFVDEKLSFHDGINCDLGENGAGKSTIHEFILAMLYWSERGRVHPVAVLERQRLSQRKHAF